MRADAESNKRALLDAAAQTMAELGPDVSLRTIAKRAGVGIATLYRHFPTREALEESLLLHVMNQVSDIANVLAGDERELTRKRWLGFAQELARLRLGALSEHFSGSARRIFGPGFEAMVAADVDGVASATTENADAQETSDNATKTKAGDGGATLLRERGEAIAAVERCLSKAASAGLVEAGLPAVRFIAGLAILTRPIPKQAPRAFSGEQNWLLQIYLRGLEPR